MKTEISQIVNHREKSPIIIALLRSLNYCVLLVVIKPIIEKMTTKTKKVSNSIAESTTQKKNFCLSLEISQNCQINRSKKGEKGIDKAITHRWVENYSVSPYKMLLQSDENNTETLGKLLGNEIGKFFELLQLQKDFKQNKFKLNKPINLKIDFWVNEKNYSLKVTNDISLKFSGENAPFNFAKFLFASLLINIKKETSYDIKKLLNETDKRDGYAKLKNLSMFNDKSLIYKLIDSPLSELETIVLN